MHTHTHAHTHKRMKWSIIWDNHSSVSEIIIKVDQSLGPNPAMVLHIQCWWNWQISYSIPCYEGPLLPMTTWTTWPLFDPWTSIPCCLTCKKWLLGDKVSLKPFFTWYKWLRLPKSKKQLSHQRPNLSHSNDCWKANWFKIVIFWMTCNSQVNALVLTWSWKTFIE